MRLLKGLCLALFIGVSLTGCASGPTYSTIQSTLPSIASEKGRIYFYREGSPFGGGIQPSIMLDGVKVGDSVPGGVFFVDVGPGNHTVTTETEVTRKLTFTLAAGQTRYVKSTVGLGVIVYRVVPELVDEKVGAEEIKSLAYTGGAK